MDQLWCDDVKNTWCDVVWDDRKDRIFGEARARRLQSNELIRRKSRLRDNGLLFVDLVLL